MSLFAELRRRNVFKVGAAYVIVGWLILQVGEVLAPALHLPDWINSALAFFIILGFPLALLFAWAFEMTPEGLKKEKDVDRSQSITHATGRKLDFTIIALLVLAVAYFAFDKFVLDPGRDRAEIEAAVQSAATDAPVAAAKSSPDTAPGVDGEKSIAVLPFVNVSADPENEYFSDGIAEELLNVLMRVSALEVASRTSSFAWKGREAPVSQIAAELGVDHVLEGSVRKSGNRVRITAQLIDAHTDRHLWSDTYERELDDIFDIQEEISGHIVEALKIALKVDEASELARLQRPTENTEAYELYLQGRFKLAQRLEENVRGAIALFERAIALDPQFAKAHEALATAWLVLPAWSGAQLSEALPRATGYANHALALEPALAEARSVLAENFVQSLEWGKALDQHEAALEREPRNASLRQWYAETLADVGYLGQALEQIQRAYELDPASPVINNVYTYIAATAGEDERAIRHMRIAKELGIPFAAYMALGSLVRIGDWDTIETGVISLIPEPAREITITCINSSRDPSLLPKLDAMMEQNPRITARLKSRCAPLVGRMDLAFEALREEVAEDPANIGSYWDQTPARLEIRRDPRFREALRDLRLVAFYEERGWPDRCRPDGAEDFRCDQE